MYTPQFRDDPNDPTEPIVQQLNANANGPQGGTLDPDNPGQLVFKGNYANPKYCLKLASAQELAGLFPRYIDSIEMHDPEDIGNDPAIARPGAPAGASNPFNAWSAKVPWFRLKGGGIANAGQVADAFSHGYPEGEAMASAARELADVQRIYAEAQES